MSNNAISLNPPSYAEDITTRGSDWLWAVFCIMAASGLALTVLTYTRPVGRRAFHYIGIAILFCASIAYFAMASNLGKTGIPVEFTRRRGDLYQGADNNPLRSIWYARYIDWTVTTPLLLLELLLTTGMPLSSIFFTVFMDLLMIETGLIGSLVQSRYKWGFFTFGCVAMLYVFWALIGPGRTYAYALSPAAGKSYFTSALFLSVLWLLYPVAWGVADGGNLITPDSEMIFYGILDILAKPVFLAWHLFALRNVEYTTFELQSGHYSVGARDDGAHANSNLPSINSHNPLKKQLQTSQVTNASPMMTGNTRDSNVTAVDRA